MLLNRHPEPGFRWARSASLWVHLTRDDHASEEMFQARALKALVLGNYSSASTADSVIVCLQKLKWKLKSEIKKKKNVTKKSFLKASRILTVSDRRHLKLGLTWQLNLSIAG